MDVRLIKGTIKNMNEKRDSAWVEVREKHGVMFDTIRGFITIDPKEKLEIDQEIPLGMGKSVGIRESYKRDPETKEILLDENGQPEEVYERLVIER